VQGIFCSSDQCVNLGQSQTGVLLLREIGELLKKITKESNFKANNSAMSMDMAINDQLELLIMQKKYGNSLTAMMLDYQEDDELISKLALPIREEKEHIGQAMKQYENTDNGGQPESLGQLILPTGLIHLGCDKKEEQLILVTEESREDKRAEPLHNYQKKVYRNKPIEKSENSQIGISQNWQDGSVAIIDNLNKKPNKVLQTTKKLIDKEEESGNLKKVMPFLNQKKEIEEKKELATARVRLNLTSSPKTEEGEVSRVKAEVEKRIDKKNLIIDKKKSKEIELSKKINYSLNKIRDFPEKLTREDYFNLLINKRRKKMEEEHGLEEESQLLENEEEQTNQHN